MKSKLLIVVLAIALLAVSIQLISTQNSGQQQPANDSGAYQTILSRTSVRAYTDQKVEKDKIEKLLRAAMAAPTAVNKQPWHFVVIEDKHVLEQIAEEIPTAKMAARAPLAITVCGDMEKALDGEGRDFWIQDASAATENLLLAAHAMGLGAVWTSVYPIKDKVEATRALLKLPETIVPLGTIVIGYPKEKPQPKDKWKPENVSYNTFGGKNAAE